MTSPAPLRVTPVGLRELAQRCVVLADGVAPPLPAVTASAWQASGAAASTVKRSAFFDDPFVSHTTQLTDPFKGIVPTVEMGR